MGGMINRPGFFTAVFTECLARGGRCRLTGPTRGGPYRRGRGAAVFAGIFLRVLIPQRPRQAIRARRFAPRPPDAPTGLVPPQLARRTLPGRHTRTRRTCAGGMMRARIGFLDRN